ncbi:schlafen family member 13 isoform X1 [Tupaia chinensis]|uniref:schlafen family member 13 isoform X1 n=1 Tax=Tupaia chinensis TaxID=246437 RepID=UPI000FFC0347|nr:schlafen family member 13 isoform X1 [Tupaia chinensis]
MNRCSLVVESCYPDLVINVGEVTLGEENRKKLQKIQRDQEKVRVTQAACALLNSGGGVIWMKLANNDEHLVEMGLDLEKSLRELVPSPHFEAFFETKQEGRCFYIFVKSWSSDISTEDSSVRPRICSLSSSLYRRSGTSVFIMDSRNAFDFLKAKRRDAECEMINDFSPPSKMSKTVYQNSSEFDLAFEIFQTHRLEYGQILPFPESQFIEFKQFSTKHIQEYVKNTVPEYVPAFANTGGGYLFIGVDDKSKKVLGCAKENVDPSSLESVIAGAVSKLPVVHFCSSKPQVGFKTKIIDVFRMGELYGYFCVIKVEQFCCAVFSQAPNSWMVKDMLLCCLTAEEWVQRMMYVDPVEKDQGLAEAFESQLNLSHRPPLCRPVYCRKGLEYKAALQQQLFPGSIDTLCSP